MTRRSFPGEPPLVVAHRGASSTNPENTLASFEAAIAIGAPFVEFDVRLSADGVPVVIHDPDLARTTDSSGPVHERTAEELRLVNAGTPEEPLPIPTLAEALLCMSGRAGAVIEIKNLPGEPDFTADAEPIVDATLRALSDVGFEGPVLVVSFNPSSVSAARSSGEDVATGLLLAGAGDPRPGVAAAVEAGHDMVLPGTWGLVPAGADVIADAHAAGIRLGTWTVDDPQAVAMLAGWGIDAIASNDPAMALSTLSDLRS